MITMDRKQIVKAVKDAGFHSGWGGNIYIDEKSEEWIPLNKLEKFAELIEQEVMDRFKIGS